MAADALNSNIVPIVLPMQGDVSNFGRGGVERIRDNPFSDLGGLLSKYSASDIFVAELFDTNDCYRVEVESRRTGESVSFTTTDDDLSAVARHAISTMNDIYKGSYSTSDLGKSVPAVIPVSDLSDWIKTERALAKIREIKEMSVRALKHNKAQLVLKYNYSLEALVSALRAGGFVVDVKDDYLILRK